MIGFCWEKKSEGCFYMRKRYNSIKVPQIDGD